MGHGSAAHGLLGMDEDVGKAPGVSPLATSSLGMGAGKKRKQEVLLDVSAGSSSKECSLKTKQEMQDYVQLLSETFTGWQTW